MVDSLLDNLENAGYAYRHHPDVRVGKDSMQSYIDEKLALIKECVIPLENLTTYDLNQDQKYRQQSIVDSIARSSMHAYDAVKSINHSSPMDASYDEYVKDKD